MGSAYYDAHSLWQGGGRLFRSLNENLRFDTCIVGAGIAGLTTAYELLHQGQSVAVLERERLGLGETGLTSAHLSNALDDGYVALQRLHGLEGARLAAESHTFAIDQIERIVQQEQIACDFERVPGYLFLGEDRPLSDLLAEFEAAQDSGLRRVRLLDRAPVRSFETGPCLMFSEQGKFHPLRYLEGLADAVVKLGGRIFTHTDVVQVQGGPETFVKTRTGSKIECESVVVATNVPFNSGMTIHSKNAPYRSYIIGVLIPPEKRDEALFWDTSHPYHYLNFVKDPTNGEDILLVGGGDHRTGQDSEPEKHFTELHEWVRRRLDIDTRVVTRWSGQVMEPVDGLAYIGHNPVDAENIFIVTGDSGHGLTHGTLAGRLLRDLILGQENPWQKLYSPSRLHFRSLSTFAKEATQSTMPYSDWLTESPVDSVREIERGEGAVLRSGLTKVAVYRDEGGRIHTCSAVCTHLGGVVRWNGAEKTWDCPCHGSRFDRYGQVINGPAQEDLKAIDETVESQTDSLPLQT